MKWALIFFCAAAPFAAGASVRIHEIAWMGTATSASDEWVELYSDVASDLNGWTLSTADGGMSVALSGAAAAGGYFLIERTDDTTVPNIPADLVAAFGSGLSNTGEILILKNGVGAEVDRVDASGGWPAGDNTTKETMQRSGSVWVTAAGTPRAVNAGSNAPPDSGDEETHEGNDSDGETSGGPSASVPEAPGMRLDAGGDRNAVVGIPLRFGAVLFDGAGNPVSSTDVLWSFGDGATARGASTYHGYRFPGDYTVFASAAYASASFTGRLAVRVRENGVHISELKPGGAGWIELANPSGTAVELEGWGISNGILTYSIPRTDIRASARLALPADSLGFAFPASGAAFLLYPNGSIADELSYSGAIAADESFHDRDGVAKAGIESPGSDRFVSRARVAPAGTSKPAPAPVLHSAETETAAAGSASQPRGDDSRKEIYGWMWWLASALGIGVLAAASYLVLRFRGFF